MRTCWYDLRYAVRLLMRSRGFFAVAVGTLAIGIGATTAMFAVVNGVLLKALPFDDPERLTLVQLLRPDDDGGPGAMRGMVWSYPKYRTFAEIQTLFDSTALFAPREVSLTHVDEPERIRGEVVTERYPGVLGINPVRGRTFTAAEANDPDSARVAMIGEGLWARRFGSDPGIIGRTIHINETPYAVVGVLPRSFRGLSGQAEAWLPLAVFEPGALDGPYSHAYTLVARRKAGITEAAAAAAARVLGQRIDEAYPTDSGRRSAAAQTLSSSRIDGDVRRTALMLFTAIGLVLLIACFNLTTLLAAKALGRRREVAIRLALGASRMRVARQFAAESVVLAVAGAAAGLFVASGLLTAGAALLPDAEVFFQRPGGASAALRGPSEGLTRVGASMIGLDVTTVLFLCVVALACASVIAMLPALHASTSRPNETLKGDAGRDARATHGRAPLVVAQIALTLIVLAGAGLMLKNVWRLQATGAGIDPDGVLAVRLQLPGASYTPARANTFLSQLTDRLRAAPGVSAVGLACGVPASGGCGGTTISFGGPRAGNTGKEPPVALYFVSPDYFPTLGIRVIEGRNFSDADRAQQPRVVIVNEAAARAFWPGANPIGQVVALGTVDFIKGAEVIGVAPNVQYEAIESEVQPGVYLPLLQAPRMAVHVFVRSNAATATLLSTIRREVQALDPNLPLADVRSMSDRLSLNTWRPRVSTWVLAAFAVLALLLTAVGIFGVTAEVVGQRTKEFAVRLALGAQKRHVLGPLLQRATVLAVLGLTLGAAGAHSD
jgi:putative ABC transport system permease protein